MNIQDIQRTGNPLPCDIHYEYDTRGYMMFYKGKPIGGAGIAKSAKGCRANLKLFRECAEREKKKICSGYISSYMREQIEKIDMEERRECRDT